jgi:hypothetical protein
MALQVMDGFEFAPNMRSAYIVSAVPAVGTGRDGTGRSIGPNASATISVPLTTPAATVIIGVGIYIPSGSFGGSASNAHYVSIFGDAGATQHLTLGVDAAAHLIIRRGSNIGTLIATGTAVLAGNAWHWIEIKATIADAGGICVVKVDGVTDINFTGDTKNAGTLTTVSSVMLFGTGTAPVTQYDDLVICDGTGSAPFNDFFGEKVIRLKAPNNNGAVNAWLGSDGNSTDNYQLVDEIPVSTTDYTGSATPGDRDLYALSNVSGLSSVDAIQNVAYVAKSDAGARSFRTVTRNAGGTVTTGPTVPLSTTYLLAQGGIELTDPSAAAWTTTNVNTIQAGVEVV